jgi:lipoprotein-releasing system permease protein
MEDDNSKVFIHLDEAQLLQNRPGGFSTIQVALTPSQNFDDLKEHVESQDERASVGTWKDRHRQRLAAIVHERKLIAIVLSMIVIVASFAILTIQWSFVKEKSKDIGILRAMGFSSSSIFCIFLGASWLVGFVGLILGLGGGALISTYANEIIAFTGWRPFPGELYYHQKLPVSIELSDAIWISALSLSVTTLAGLCPAWKATRLEPVAAIAHE